MIDYLMAIAAIIAGIIWYSIGGWTGLAQAILAIAGGACIVVWSLRQWQVWHERKSSEVREEAHAAAETQGELPPSPFPEWYDVREQAAGYLAKIQSDAKYKTEEREES